MASRSLVAFPDKRVTVTRHRALNIVKGVISEYQLLDCSDTEIEEGLKDQGVVTARRIVMRRDGKDIPTRHIVLSFQLHRLPQTIKAGYLNCHVCRGQATCPKCAGMDHSAESCANEVRCANCKGSHPVYSRSCPRWQEEKETLKMKVTQHISYREAKTQVEFARKGTYSEVVRRGVAPLRKSVESRLLGLHPTLSTPNTRKACGELASAGTSCSGGQPGSSGHNLYGG
ncbi:uncharacterized protein LOC135371448 [Ornithodoros turicata]|uniref:uncharacterized protein LOC135371448 n=1 Tax=Ornithodoros turicata TaxID=34597 RepID=UPI003139DE01